MLSPEPLASVLTVNRAVYCF